MDVCGDDLSQKIDAIRQQIETWNNKRKISSDQHYFLLASLIESADKVANYHLLNTIAKYDTFVPRGKTGLRRYNKSSYSSKLKLKNAFEELIKNAHFSYVFLSYNNEGLMPPETVKKIMSTYGKFSLATIEYQRFKADKTQNRNHKASYTTEYLHILEK